MAAAVARPLAAAVARASLASIDEGMGGSSAEILKFHDDGKCSMEITKELALKRWNIKLEGSVTLISENLDSFQGKVISNVLFSFVELKTLSALALKTLSASATEDNGMRQRVMLASEHHQAICKEADMTVRISY